MSFNFVPELNNSNNVSGIGIFKKEKGKTP